MVQDLTDVFCTAGKRSAVLPLVPFQCSSAICPPIFPLSISLSLCSPPTASLSFSLSLCSLFISIYILSHVLIPRPFLPLSLVYYHCPFILLSPFHFPSPSIPFHILLPLFFPFSLFPSHCFFLPSSPSHYSLFRGFNNSLVAGKSSRLYEPNISLYEFLLKNLAKISPVL